MLRSIPTLLLALLTLCALTAQANEALIRKTMEARVQGINDACVFATMAVSSFSSGMLLHADGWSMLNRISLVPLAVMLAALIWMARVRRAAAVTMPA